MSKVSTLSADGPSEVTSTKFSPFGHTWRLRFCTLYSLGSIMCLGHCLDFGPKGRCIKEGIVTFDARGAMETSSLALRKEVGEGVGVG